MSIRESISKWRVVGNLLTPFVDQRKGGDRRHALDAEHGGVSPWAEKRKSDRRRNQATALLCISALFVTSAAAGEKVSFAASNGFTVENVNLRAEVSKPEGSGPFPAIVLMHGCGGWQPAVRYAMAAYADYLVAHGFVVLALDSFGPRNIGGGKVCESIRTQRDALNYRLSDAYDALKYLRTLNYVNGKNIFLMGQSNGGSVAIDVAKGDTPNNVDPKTEGYRAVAAYYPWCGSFGGKKVELETPLTVFSGEQDDWTPASECQEVKSTKAALEFKSYPTAAHSFDLEIMRQQYLGKSIGYDKEAAEDSRQRMLAFFIEHTVGIDWKNTRLANSGPASAEARLGTTE